MAVIFFFASHSPRPIARSRPCMISRSFHGESSTRVLPLHDGGLNVSSNFRSAASVAKASVLWAVRWTCQLINLNELTLSRFRLTEARFRPTSHRSPSAFRVRFPLMDDSVLLRLQQPPRLIQLIQYNKQTKQSNIIKTVRYCGPLT